MRSSHWSSVRDVDGVRRAGRARPARPSSTAAAASMRRDRLLVLRLRGPARRRLATSRSCSASCARRAGRPRRRPWSGAPRPVQAARVAATALRASHSARGPRARRGAAPGRADVRRGGQRGARSRPTRVRIPGDERVAVGDRRVHRCRSRRRPSPPGPRGPASRARRRRSPSATTDRPRSRRAAGVTSAVAGRGQLGGRAAGPGSAAGDREPGGPKRDRDDARPASRGSRARDPARSVQRQRSAAVRQSRRGSAGRGRFVAQVPQGALHRRAARTRTARPMTSSGPMLSSRSWRSWSVATGNGRPDRLGRAGDERDQRHRHRDDDPPLAERARTSAVISRYVQ